jgi:hypothetical protein
MVADFLRDVIALSGSMDSPKADRASLVAADLLAKLDVAKEDKCLARAMGYGGPTGEVIVSSVAHDVLKRSHAALREFGADVDMQTVTAGLAAAARVVRASVRAEHGGCVEYMMRLQLGANGLAPRGISHRAPAPEDGA